MSFAYILYVCVCACAPHRLQYPKKSAEGVISGT